MADKLVKVFDMYNNHIGKGYLLNIYSDIIMIKGTNLPILNLGDEVIIEVYNEFTDISQYFCTVNIASANQLNALIKNANLSFERRTSLKIRTDLIADVKNICRNDEDVTDEFSNMSIHILNLSIGGMLISSNYELLINDVITFNFYYENNSAILLKAKIIRIDKIYDEDTKQTYIQYYGCMFGNMPRYYEDIITKYLYHRQILMYKEKEGRL